MRPQLVLDAGGVLVRDLRPEFWRQVHSRFGLFLEQRFRETIRNDFWAGIMTIEEFYLWLERQTGSTDASWFRTRIPEVITPLPALGKINLWSSEADLHLLSNHRTPWLSSSLGPLWSRFRSTTISDECGATKPQPEIFAVAANHLNPGPVLYVDDRSENLSEGARRGWEPLLAEADGRWIDRVDEWITSR